jgi:LAO/AO transport system kinase
LAREYADFVTKSDFLKVRRLEQSRYWMYETLKDGIYMQVFNDPDMKKELKAHEKAISEGRITSFMAASSILNKYKSGK